MGVCAAVEVDGASGRCVGADDAAGVGTLTLTGDPKTALSGDPLFKGDLR